MISIFWLIESIKTFIWPCLPIKLTSFTNSNKDNKKKGHNLRTSLMCIPLKPQTQNKRPRLTKCSKWLMNRKRIKMRIIKKNALLFLPDSRMIIYEKKKKKIISLSSNEANEKEEKMKLTWYTLLKLQRSRYW